MIFSMLTKPGRLDGVLCILSKRLRDLVTCENQRKPGLSRAETRSRPLNAFFKVCTPRWGTG